MSTFPTQRSMDPMKIRANGATIASATGLDMAPGANMVPDVFRHVRLTVSSLTITLTKASATGYGSQKLLDFDQGLVVVLGALANFTAATTGANSGASEDLLFSLGSTATGDATLSTTEVSVLPSTAITMAARAGTGGGQTSAITYINGTSTAADLYLNVAQAANVTTGDSSCTLTGTIDVIFAILGDY